MNRRELLKSTLAAGMGLAVGPLATMGGIVSKKDVSSDLKVLMEEKKISKIEIFANEGVSFMDRVHSDKKYRMDVYFKNPDILFSTYNMEEIDKVIKWDKKWDIKEIRIDDQLNVEFKSFYPKFSGDWHPLLSLCFTKASENGGWLIYRIEPETFVAKLKWSPTF